MSNTSETQPRRVLIITSDTGGGHSSAAAAIADGLHRSLNHGCLVKIVRAIEESHFFARKMADLYNYLLRHHQDLVKYYYRAIEQLRPYESSFLFRFTGRYTKQLFEKFCPQILVSVHPMTQHFFARTLRELGLLDRIPIVTVVTDPCYGFWKGWACDEVSLYLVATEEARQQLIDYGILPEKIRICGLPIHSRFQPTDEAGRIAIRNEMGLDPERFTIFINAGWIGGGNIPRIFEEMVSCGPELRETQAIFLAGKNDRLYAEIDQLARRAPFPTKVVGYTNAMEKLMSAADVMISKLGGLTTFEALASRLPIIVDAVTTPMPQESRTANLISGHRAGLLLKNVREVVPLLRRLAGDLSEMEAMRVAASKLATPHATQQIVNELMRKIEERLPSEPTLASGTVHLSDQA
ncbi:MAG: MGDG synthase family glycosyltransferase [Blastocatellia bacterium]